MNKMRVIQGKEATPELIDQYLEDYPMAASLQVSCHVKYNEDSTYCTRVKDHTGIHVSHQGYPGWGGEGVEKIKYWLLAD